MAGCDAIGRETKHRLRWDAWPRGDSGSGTMSSYLEPADCAQFSAAATELSPPEYIGTVLTMQTGMGFILTLFSIPLVPLFVDTQGWSLALGIWTMLSLRRPPETTGLAGGRL